MLSKKIDLSKYESNKMSSAKNMRFGILVSEWNKEVTSALLEGSISTLLKHEAINENIVVEWVPGSFELVLAAQYFARETKVDAIICLGCIIQGETRHFEFISQAVAKGIMDVNIKYNIPVIFGVLTTDTTEQAIARSGGKHGNKGIEAAATAISMLRLRNSFNK